MSATAAFLHIAIEAGLIVVIGLILHLWKHRRSCCRRPAPPSTPRYPMNITVSFPSTDTYNSDGAYSAHEELV